MTEKQLENYINGKYIGIVKGHYETYCSLRAGEINNFVQNAGRFADLEVIKLKGYEILFDTNGQFINRIWPELSEGDRKSHEMKNTINQIASKLLQLRENDISGDTPLPKVQKFMEEMFGVEMISNDSSVIETSVQEEENTIHIEMI